MKSKYAEKNKLIAEFMKTRSAIVDNMYFGVDGMLYTEENLRYHFSWDWLMPVVKEIDELGFNTQISRISVKISEILCEDKPIISLVCGDLSQKNNLVWLAVCDFIKWYNEKNK